MLIRNQESEINADTIKHLDTDTIESLFLSKEIRFDQIKDAKTRYMLYADRSNEFLNAIFDNLNKIIDEEPDIWNSNYQYYDLVLVRMLVSDNKKDQNVDIIDTLKKIFANGKNKKVMLYILFSLTTDIYKENDYDEIVDSLIDPLSESLKDSFEENEYKELKKNFYKWNKDTKFNATIHRLKQKYNWIKCK